jgi:uncharacterized protein YfbU (UPF0304 family)
LFAQRFEVTLNYTEAKEPLATIEPFHFSFDRTLNISDHDLNDEELDENLTELVNKSIDGIRIKKDLSHILQHCFNSLQKRFQLMVDNWEEKLDFRGFTSIASFVLKSFCFFLSDLQQFFKPQLRSENPFRSVMIERVGELILKHDSSPDYEELE